MRTIRSHSLLVWTLHKLGPQRKWVPVGRTTDLFYKKKIKIKKKSEDSLVKRRVNISLIYSEHFL